MVARAQGTSLIFHFVAYRYRGAAAARRGSGGGPPRGIVTPSPPSFHEERAHKAGEKRWRGRERIPGKEGKTNIYIYIYRAEGRRSSIPGARSWCTLLHRKTERSRGDSFFTFLPPLPRKQGRSFREYNPCYRLLSGRNDDFLVHPSSLASLNRSSSLLKLGSVGCLSMDYGIYRCVYRWIRGFVEFFFCKSFST